MPNKTKTAFLQELTKRYSTLRKLDKSQSLYELGNGSVRIYVRYSKVHGGNRTFYGLRQEDLRKLEGHASIVCFIWDDQAEPLFIPLSEYEDVFHAVSPAGDGQYKAQVYLGDEGTELYIARAGRFNVEGQFGWATLDGLVSSAGLRTLPDISHSQMQTLIGAIGAFKSHDIWIPPTDRGKLDWSITGKFECRSFLPHGFSAVDGILQEVDVVWINRGSNELRALFEIEHSTPVYSALLRFNDIHLIAPNIHPRFSVVANESRRALFVRQLSRPTFQASGLIKECTFLEYGNVFDWHERVRRAEG